MPRTIDPESAARPGCRSPGHRLPEDRARDGPRSPEEARVERMIGEDLAELALRMKELARPPRDRRPVAEGGGNPRVRPRTGARPPLVPGRRVLGRGRGPGGVHRRAAPPRSFHPPARGGRQRPRGGILAGPAGAVPHMRLRLGTRSSRLALWQAQRVADLLRGRGRGVRDRSHRDAG